MIVIFKSQRMICDIRFLNWYSDIQSRFVTIEQLKSTLFFTLLIATQTIILSDLDSWVMISWENQPTIIHKLISKPQTCCSGFLDNIRNTSSLSQNYFWIMGNTWLVPWSVDEEDNVGKVQPLWPDCSNDCCPEQL